MVRLALVLVSLLVAVSGGAQDRGLEAVAQQWSGTPNLDIGKQFVVLIGIDKYQQWPVLKEPGTEARNLKKVLAANYFVDEFIELYDGDATAANIRKLFSQTLPSRLGLHDSLLVFFAGHGHLDDSKSGFWIPVDGGTDALTQDRWLPNAQLRNYLGQLKAQRILVLSDSCFSGDLLDTDRGSSPDTDPGYLKKALQLTCRQVLTSGASEAVPDQSEFSRELLGALERNTDPVVDTYSLYAKIRRGVTKTTPLLGALPGNEAGASFLLFRRKEPLAVPVSDPPPVDSGTLVHVVSAEPFRAWAVPGASPGSEPVPVTDRCTLAPGTWVVQASQPDDSVLVWSQELRVPPTGDVTLEIPKLPHSRDYSIRALNVQRSLLVTQAEEDRGTAQAMRGWGGLFTLVGFGGLAAVVAAQADSHYDLGLMTADTNKKLLFGGSAAAIIGIPLGIIISLSNPENADRDNIRKVDAEISRLEKERQDGLP